MGPKKGRSKLLKRRRRFGKWVHVERQREGKEGGIGTEVEI